MSLYVADTFVGVIVVLSFFVNVIVQLETSPDPLSTVTVYVTGSSLTNWIVVFYVKSRWYLVVMEEDCPLK